MMTKLRSGQGNRDADVADYASDAADQSNTYMSPSQSTQKPEIRNPLPFRQLLSCIQYLIGSVHALKTLITFLTLFGLCQTLKKRESMVG